MFDHAIAYHREQIRQNQHVRDADGNLYSDHHRAEARKALAEHETILAELTRPYEGVKGIKAIEVLKALVIDDRYEAKRLDRLSEGTEKGSFSRQEMAREIAKRTERADAVEVALVLLTEAAERPVIRHKKRGSTYDLYTGDALLQTDHPLKDNDTVGVYRDRASGRWFVRASGEMVDGRFDTPGDLPPTEEDGYEVELLFDDMDDRTLRLTLEEIAQAETHGTLSLDWMIAEYDEDIWGDYVVREVLYERDSERVASLGLRRL